MSVIDLFEVALDIQNFCDGHGWRSCFIGGVAVQRWSEPQVTRGFALRSRVLLLTSPSGVGIDISLGALAFEYLVVERAAPFEFVPGVSLRTCSAEDLMVMKLFASRSIDIRDAEGVAVRQGKTLDWDYVREQLTPLAGSQGGRGHLA